jgi:hypothetical protein
MEKLTSSFCIGDFYLIGKIDINKLNIEKDESGYNISFSIAHEDIKRIDDPTLKNTKNEVKSNSNVLQIDFKTGEKKWI